MSRILSDAAMPRVGERLALCYACQRKIVLAGGILEYLTRLLARTALFKEVEPTFTPIPTWEISDEASAYAVLKLMRWPQTGGQPLCPKCGAPDAYEHNYRPRWTCRSCQHQFTVTSGTPFASRKVSYRALAEGILALASEDAPPAYRLARRFGMQPTSLWKWAQRMRASRSGL